MEYSLKEVAGRIKDLREAKGYTQEELAKLTGVSLEDYLILEKGETDFSFTFIYKCAKACGVEVVDLLEGTSTTLTSFAITRISPSHTQAQPLRRKIKYSFPLTLRQLKPLTPLNSVSSVSILITRVSSSPRSEM